MNLQKQTILPSRETVTAAQVQTVLGIAGTMMNFLSQPALDPENPHKPGGAIDGGARLAAEATLVHACNRLDSLLTDGGRWSMELHNLLEVQLVKMLTEQIAFLKAQTAASQSLSSPHYQQKPVLGKTADGTWVAYTGTAKDMLVFGIGDSPAAAFEDFDAAFNGIVTQNQLDYLQKHTDSIENKKGKKK